MPRIQLDGVALHYEDSGVGDETIVFSHGLLWSGRMFDGQVAALKDRYRCIAYDHRGQGASDVTSDGYDMDTVTGDAAALIEKLGVGPCHFVGLSMGGFVGLRLAARRPELLRSLVVVDSAADAEPAANHTKYKLMVWAVRLFGVRAVSSRVMKIMFARPFLDDAARAGERAEMKRRLESNDAAGAGRATMGVVLRASVEAELGRIKIPTLVLSGDEDSAVVPARSRRTAEQIAGARFQTIPRAGHTSSVEEPAAVAAAIETFLAELPRA